MAKNIFFASLYVLFMHGVSDVDKNRVSVSVMEGDSITLKTDVETNQQDRIRWYFNDTCIAQITGDLSKICTDVQCNEGTERFRDRLKLDNQTGSLTIRNISTTDAGFHLLEVNKNNNIIENIFIVAVHGVPAAEQDEMEGVKEGESVTLDPGGIKSTNYVMMWYFNDSLIAEITGDLKERFRDRLELDNQTGSLTITNTRTTDSGLYHLLINSSRFSILKTFNVTIIDSHVETSPQDLFLHGFKEPVGVVLSLIVALAIVVSVICLCKKHKQKKQKYELIRVFKLVGQSVTLDTGIEVQTDNHIQWMFEDKKSLIAQIKGTAEITYNCDGDKSFRDRLELDSQTGSLTITNTRTTDSGDYTLQITRSGKTSSKRFNVTVSDSHERTMAYESEMTEMSDQSELIEIKTPLM